jgi:hypothetical protein
MAKYIVVHVPLMQKADQNELFGMMRSIAEAQVVDTEWISSWLSVDSSRMFCLWEAPNEESIREAIGDVLAVSPIESVCEVVLVDPAYFT